MSQRPRLAGDGRLRVPEKVALYWKGFVRGRLSERTVDPFDWTEDRLLLAESFARLDLDDRPAAKGWFVRHGVVDRGGFVGPPAEPPDYYSNFIDWMHDRGTADIADHRRDVGAEQANVAWHLTMLARLSEARLTRAWAPGWGRLIVDGPEGELVVGGPDAGARLMLPTTVEALRRGSPDDPKDRAAVAEGERLRAATHGWPVVEVGEALWYDSWDSDAEEVGPTGPLPEDPRDKARALGADWDQALALVRLLMAPYVSRAVERRFTMTFETQETKGTTRTVLVPREERAWQSILAPIYLQLFEALRRITEGEPGAAVCHECGRPFLVLDARRRFFCNERERYRYAKRQQRSRPDIVLDDGTEIEVKVRRRRG